MSVDEQFPDDFDGAEYEDASPSAADADPALAKLFARLDGDEAIRPWSWTELPEDEAEALMRVLTGFVQDFNLRYAWTKDQLVPPCWPAHGGLLEELTTLWWSRYAAFDTPGAKASDAQAWHEKSLPGFLKRMPTWLSPDVCIHGKHDDPNLWPARSEAGDGLTPQARELTRKMIAAELQNADNRTIPRRPLAEPDAPGEDDEDEE